MSDTDNSLSDESDVEGEGTELTHPVATEKYEGKVTGITVLTDNDLTNRTAKWKKTISSTVITVDYMNRHKDITYVLIRALQFQMLVIFPSAQYQRTYRVLQLLLP